jgi:acyl-coenzyme A synthetase/AMP-(fatty) acid ligase
MVGEQLVIAIRLEDGQSFSEALKHEIIQRNNRLLNYKRIHGIVLFDEDFPRTASLKIKRNELAARLAQLDRDRVILPL